jgi:hypothetical protein
MNPGRGIALKLASTFVFTLMLVCVKAVAEEIPAGEIVFARSFFALIPIVGILVWQRQLAGALRTSRPWLHVSRGAVGLISMALNFIALAYLPLPEAMMIGYASPLIIVVLAALLLGEVVRGYRWSAGLRGDRHHPVAAAHAVRRRADRGHRALRVHPRADQRLLLGLRGDLHPLDDEDGIDRHDRALFRAELLGAVAARFAAARLGHS